MFKSVQQTYFHNTYVLLYSVYMASSKTLADSEITQKKFFVQTKMVQKAAK